VAVKLVLSSHGPTHSLSGIRFAYALKRVEGGSAVIQVRGPVERFFNPPYEIGVVPSDPAAERADTLAAAEMIRIKFVDYMRRKNVFLITDGRKYGGRQSYPLVRRMHFQTNELSRADSQLSSDAQQASCTPF
jgi:hypothetical protein